MDVSIQTEAGLSQRLQAQGDIFQSYHNVKKLVDHLIYLEQGREFKKTKLPYSPEFRAMVREEYLNRVLGYTFEPDNHDNEEEENGSEEADEASARDPGSSD